VCKYVPPPVFVLRACVLSLTHAHSAQGINDDKLPRRPVDAKPLKHKSSLGKVTIKNTVFLNVFPSSAHKWGARWSDGHKQCTASGFPTDLAAARHAAERNVLRRIPGHLDAASVHSTISLKATSFDEQTCSIPFDEHTYVS
jgi:hypothetical protein